MIIKIAEKPNGTLSLWVQEKPGDDQPPTHTAAGRTREQVIALLTVILAEQGSTVIAPEVPASRLIDVTKPVIQSATLYAMLTAVDGWVQGAKENHDACDHRGENRGEECWRSFAPSDIRSMVNDVCRELGISEFPLTSVNVEDR